MLTVIGALVFLKHGVGIDLGWNSPSIIVPRWQFEHKRDPMEDQEIYSAYKDNYTERGENIQTIAECETDSVVLSFIYLDKDGGPTGLSYKGMSVGDSQKMLWVPIKYRVGESESQTTVSISEYRNQARLKLFRRDAANGPSIEQIERAQILRVQLPLANGDTPIITLNAGESGFRDFLEACPASRARR